MPRCAWMFGARIERICRSRRLNPCAAATSVSAYHPARLTFAGALSGASATVVAIDTLPAGPALLGGSDSRSLAVQRRSDSVLDRRRRAAGELAQVGAVAVEL